MRNQLTVTLSSIKGVKQLTLTAEAWRFVLAVGLLVVITSVLLGVGAYWLMDKLSVLEEAKKAQEIQYEAVLSEERHKYVTTLQEKATLEQGYLQTLESKEEELENLNDKVGELGKGLTVLETMLNLEIPTQDEVDVERLQSIKNSLKLKKLMLMKIPSGQPVDTFHGYSSLYGKRLHPMLKKQHFHTGLDYRGKVGDAILSTANGVVEYAGYHKKSGYGKLVIINHSYGFKTFYAHLDKIHVTRGQVVERGFQIGNMGNTGISTGTHLHYEVLFLGNHLNPIRFAEWNLDDYSTIMNKERRVPWQSLASLVINEHQLITKPFLPEVASSVVN